MTWHKRTCQSGFNVEKCNKSARVEYSTIIGIIPPSCSIITGIMESIFQQITEHNPPRAIYACVCVCVL